MATKQEAQPKKSKLLWVVLIFVCSLAALVWIGVALTVKDDFSLKPAIAVIPIKGEIGVDGSADPADIVELIEKAEKEFTVKAIILDINSPGGSVVATQEIAAAIRKAEKPTVSWVREIGASGALWVAVAADKVIASPSSIMGSIGVTASYLSFEKLMEKYGVSYNRLVTGEFKDTGSQYKSLTAEEQEYLMSKLDYVKLNFVYAIAKDRNLSVEYVDELADGKIWLGYEAQQYGLVDTLGGKAEAQEAAEELAGLKESRLVMLEKKPTFAELFSAKSLGYWMGRGLGAEFLSVGSEQKLEIGA